MTKITKWSLIIAGEGCVHDFHIVWSTEFEDEGKYQPLTEEELALYILRYGITREELEDDNGHIVRGYPND